MNRIAITLLAGVAGIALASSAYAADLIIDEPAPVVGIVDTTGNWDGVYIGAFAGYGWGTVADDEEALVPNLTDDELSLSGWQVGVTAGANFTFAESLVAGIVADVAWNDLNGEEGAFSYSTDWSGSLRGRLGFDGGAFLPYVTAGLAVASATANDGAFEDSATYFGWTAGAGVEFAVSENVSLDLQYRYTDYGSQDFALTNNTPLSLTSHAVTAGVNFRF